MFNFDKTKVQNEQDLGSGAFGTVYPYKDDKQTSDLVVKHITTTKLEVFLDHIQEIVLGFSLDHPNLIPVKGYHLEFDKDQKIWNIYILFPRMQKTLFQEFDSRIKQNKHFTEEEIRNYFADLVNGLHHLHSKMIVHRDLKPDNILILNNQAKISDIGLGRLITEGTSSLVSRAGIPHYVAPEILEDMSNAHKNQLFKADVWSLGMIMLELCALKSKVVNMFSHQREADLALKRQELERIYSSELLDLLFGLLKFNPDERMSIEQVQEALSNKFVSGESIGGVSKIEGDSQLKPKIGNLEVENRGLKNQLHDLKIQLRDLMQVNTRLDDQIKELIKQNTLLQQLNLEKVPVLISENKRLCELIDQKNEIIEEWQSKYAVLLSQNERINEIIDIQCRTIEELQSTKTRDNTHQIISENRKLFARIVEQSKIIQDLQCKCDVLKKLNSL